MAFLRSYHHADFLVNARPDGPSGKELVHLAVFEGDELNSIAEHPGDPGQRLRVTPRSAENHFVTNHHVYFRAKRGMVKCSSRTLYR